MEDGADWLCREGAVGACAGVSAVSAGGALPQWARLLSEAAAKVSRLQAV